jgi:phospholipid/cholesterol/gamma-HCH transport system substrate-binding protein
VRSVSVVGRAAAIGAVLIAAIVVGFLLVGRGGGGYSVTARFENASQIVKGNLVQVAGTPIGKVTQIDLTGDGQAALTLDIDKDYAPLRRGTQATIRQSSLSGVANRYVDLRLAPDKAAKISDGGVIEQGDTTTAVDLDELFNTFDPKTRASLQGLIRGSAAQHEGAGERAARGLRYVSPALIASSRLFDEVNRDTDMFERFVVESSKLVTDVADRRDDLAGLVNGLADTTQAIGRRNTELADAIGRLPDFMRRSNTTFVNLRAALDDVDPLVDASKPVAKKLRPFLAELRPLAEDARPTIRDLSKLVKRSGAGNDLIELTRAQIPLRDVAVGPVEVNGKRRDGALTASTKALSTATPELAFARPYAVDLTGWFDDFGHSGFYDALGGASRVSPNVAAFANLNGVLAPVPPALRDQVFREAAQIGQNNRCPGAAERQPWKPSADFNCDLGQKPPGK